jgi:flagellar biosynthesis protein FlhB
MAEKTEQPTSKKRKDSAKKGQTFKSKDVITTVILLMGIYFLAHAVSFGPFISFYTHLLQYPTQPGMGLFLLELARIFYADFALYCGVYPRRFCRHLTANGIYAGDRSHQAEF